MAARQPYRATSAAVCQGHRTLLRGTTRACAAVQPRGEAGISYGVVVGIGCAAYDCGSSARLAKPARPEGARLDDRTATDRPLPQRRRGPEAARADEGGDEPEHRAARVRVFGGLLRLPLRDDA